MGRKVTASRTHFQKAQSKLLDYISEYSDIFEEFQQLSKIYNNKLGKYTAALREEALIKKDTIQDGKIKAAYKETNIWDIDKLKQMVPWDILMEYGVAVNVSYSVNDKEIIRLVKDEHISKKKLETAKDIKPGTALYHAPKSIKLDL